MCSLLHHAPVMNDTDEVSVLNRGQTMRYDNRRAALTGGIQSLLDNLWLTKHGSQRIKPPVCLQLFQPFTSPTLPQSVCKCWFASQSRVRRCFLCLKTLESANHLQMSVQGQDILLCHLSAKRVHKSDENSMKNKGVLIAIHRKDTSLSTPVHFKNLRFHSLDPAQMWPRQEAESLDYG